MADGFLILCRPEKEVSHLSLVVYGNDWALSNRHKYHICF